MLAFPALYASKSSPRIPADKQSPELALDILRKRLAIMFARVREKRLQMLARELVQSLALRLASLVLERSCRAGSSRHDRRQEPAPCQHRSAEIA
jgi:hypothetical protein